jgi:tetratricopeptide (TPR) repeat protein
MFGRKRRGPNPWKIAFYSLAFGMIGLVLWQFNAIQPRVLAMVGVAATPTPSMLEYARRGEAAYLNGDLTAAVTAYTLAAEQSSTNVSVVHELIRMLIYRSFADVRNFGDADTALVWATRLAEANASNARAQAILCYALLRVGRAEDGVRACLRAVDIDQNMADAHAYLSMANYDLARYETALEEGERAVRLAPQSIDANLAYARALVFRGQFDAALQHFTEAARVNPALEFPYYELASTARRIAIARNDSSPFLVAVASYNEVLKRNPNNVKALTRLCEAFLEKSSRDVEDIRQARLYCETATEVDSTYSPAWRVLGQVYHSSRNYESAIEALDQCTKLEAGFRPELRSRICWWLRAAGLFVLGKDRCDEATRVANEMLSWTPQSEDEQAFREANKVILKCALAFEEGRYQTPTPIPTPTSPPPPIL